MAETYKLTYFNLRAVGEPIRLLFAYKKIQYEDIRIEYNQDWPAQKKNYPWGQLPVLQVGDKTLAQSLSILRYLGKKFDMYGTNDWEKAQIDEIADIISDLRSSFTPVFLEKDATKKAELLKNFAENILPKHYERLEAIIAKNDGNTYFVGSKLNWIDIQCAHYMELFDAFAPGVCGHYLKLNKLKKKVFENPNIKSWVEKRPKTPA